MGLMLPLDGEMGWPFAVPVISPARQRRGRTADMSGRLAEESVARLLRARGVTVLAQRWRGKSGEIDLICKQRDCVIFVEVKCSRTHAEAAARLDRRQQARICDAALEYCGSLPTGLETEMRFDVALVDAMGRIDILENAFGDCFA